MKYFIVNKALRNQEFLIILSSCKKRRKNLQKANTNQYVQYSTVVQYVSTVRQYRTVYSTVVQYGSTVQYYSAVVQYTKSLFNVQLNVNKQYRLCTQTVSFMYTKTLYIAILALLFYGQHIYAQNSTLFFFFSIHV